MAIMFTGPRRSIFARKRAMASSALSVRCCASMTAAPGCDRSCVFALDARAERIPLQEASVHLVAAFVDLVGRENRRRRRRDRRTPRAPRLPPARRRGWPARRRHSSARDERGRSRRWRGRRRARRPWLGRLRARHAPFGCRRRATRLRDRSAAAASSAVTAARHAACSRTRHVLLETGLALGHRGVQRRDAMTHRRRARCQQ